MILAKFWTVQIASRSFVLLVASLLIAPQVADARVCLRNPSPFATPADISSMQTTITALQARVVALENAALIDVWVSAWRGHNGTLTNGTRVPTSGNGAREWSVTANVGGTGTHTASGDAWCGTSSTAPPSAHSASGTNCWCRMTGPRAGSWVLQYGPGTASSCAAFCASNCSFCVLNGSGFSCTRGAVLG